MNYDNKWYSELIKSKFNPPNYIFKIVWPILYITLFISFLLIYTNKKCNKYCNEISFFILHLFFNLIWAPIFFIFKNITLALFINFLIFVTLILVICKFYKINKLSSIILFPYLFWIIFAFYLNFYIYLKN